MTCLHVALYSSWTDFCITWSLNLKLNVLFQRHNQLRCFVFRSIIMASFRLASAIIVQNQKNSRTWRRMSLLFSGPTLMSPNTPVSVTKSSIVARPSSERYSSAVLFMIIGAQCMATLECPLIIEQFSIGQVRDINILTWLRGVQVKLLYLVLFSLCLFWELRDKNHQKFAIFTPKARSHVKTLTDYSSPLNFLRFLLV